MSLRLPKRQAAAFCICKSRRANDRDDRLNSPGLANFADRSTNYCCNARFVGVLVRGWNAMDISELLSKFDGGELIGLVAVTGSLLVGAWGIMMCYLSQAQKTRRVEALTALKQDMLQRGMSAQDIRAVLDCGSDGVRKGLRRCFLG
jgi:hypothetical protein